MSFINYIINQNECRVGNDYKAYTQKLKNVDILRDGYNFHFFDTPGLDDEKIDEENINQLNLKEKNPSTNILLICIDFIEIRLSKPLTIEK